MIGLHEPSFQREEEEVLLDALRSTWVSTGGPYVERFENDFARYVGSKFAVSVSNGTLALHLLIETLKRIKNVDTNFDVIVPSMSFIATSNAVFHSGGTPILVDCSKGSMNLDSRDVQLTIERNYQSNGDGRFTNKNSGNRLLCIMPAHIMGFTCDMDNLLAYAAKLEIPVIEDAAEALGSRYFDGTHVGTTSLAAIFSFNGNKILTTGGGGMIVTNDEKIASLSKHLSTTAKTDNLRYVHDQVGFNYRMVNLLAAIGVSQLARLDRTLNIKKSIFDMYAKKLSKIGIETFQENNNVGNNWIVNAIFKTEELREKALAALLREKIQARPLWTPAHKLSFFKDNSVLSPEYPNSEFVWKHVLSLPSSANLNEEIITNIVRIIGESSQ